jgi:hypothetical protein
MALIPSGAAEDSSKSENGAAWAEMSEEKLKSLMQKGAQKLAAHIANDLRTNDISDEEREAEEAVEQTGVGEVKAKPEYVSSG